MRKKSLAIVIGLLVITGLTWRATRSADTDAIGASQTDLRDSRDRDEVPNDMPLELPESLPSDTSFIVQTRVDHERLLVDGLREQSYGRVDLPLRGEDALAAMSQGRFDEYTDELTGMLREVQRENWEAAGEFIEGHRQAWPRQECPANGPIDRALFDEALSNAIGLESFDSVPGFEVYHVADISLPDGVVHLNTASFDGSWSVDLEAPGVHPFYMASAIWDDLEYVSSAQLVVAAGDPARWVEDERFRLEAEYAQLWIGGADSLVEANFDPVDVIESIAYAEYVQELIVDWESPCEHWAHADGRNVVRQDASFDGSFPAYVAYGADGQLLAVTWDFGEVYREQQTEPGIELPTPTPAPAASAGSPIDTDL